MNIVVSLTKCNYNRLDYKREIDMIVLHSTASLNVQGVLAHFNNPESKVSAHYVIDTDGTVYKVVNTNDIAWHAVGYNKRSIGIELVQTPDTRLTFQQLLSLFELLIRLLQSMPSIKYLQAHYELSGNKIDPYDRNLVPALRNILKLKNIREEESGRQESVQKTNYRGTSQKGNKG